MNKIQIESLKGCTSVNSARIPYPNNDTMSLQCLTSFLVKHHKSNPAFINVDELLHPDPHAPWVGVDFDGTLAHYDGFKGVDHIGEYIGEMCDMVAQMIDYGIRVRIFTARVCPVALEMNAKELDCSADDLKESITEAIQTFCLEYIGFKLPVTNVKTYSCIGFIDDRAIPVARNEGKLLVNTEELEKLMPSVF